MTQYTTCDNNLVLLVLAYVTVASDAYLSLAIRRIATSLRNRQL